MIENQEQGKQWKSESKNVDELKRGAQLTQIQFCNNLIKVCPTTYIQNDTGDKLERKDKH